MSVKSDYTTWRDHTENSCSGWSPKSGWVWTGHRRDEDKSHSQGDPAIVSRKFQSHHPGARSNSSFFFDHLDFYLEKDIFPYKKRNFWKRIYFRVKKGIVHSHRDLEVRVVIHRLKKMKLSNFVVPLLMCTDHHVELLQTGGSITLRLKPATRNSLQLMFIVTGGREVSTLCIGSHYKC